MNPFNQARIIGIGNEFRGDDAAGLLTARRLQKLFNGKATILEQSGEGSSLMESWAGAEHVTLIDAVQSGQTVGTLHRFDAGRETFSSETLRCSTHTFGIAQCIELARALGKLPTCLIIYGIEGNNFEIGSTISPEVARAVNVTAQKIYEELTSVRHPDYA